LCDFITHAKYTVLFLKINATNHCKNPALLTHPTQVHHRGLLFILATLALSMASVSMAETSTEVIQSMDTDEQDMIALPGAIEIEGDKLDLYLDRKMRASGNAVITRGDQKVYGDQIEYDVQNDELQVNGNVKISIDNGQITGPTLRMRLSESIGEMRDASIQFNKSPPADTIIDTEQSTVLNDQSVIFSDPKRYLDNDNSFSDNQALTRNLEGSRGDAKMVLFEGQDKKRLQYARYTTCEAGVDDWYIKANDLELDDYTQSGVAKNAYVEFKGVPLLYTPWLSFSFNNQRKSGLLAPTVGTTSRSGFEVFTPYYWNIRPDMDATLATRYLSKRGLQVSGEFRYLDESYSGISGLEYLNKDSQSGQNRYYANFSHRHQLGPGWSAGYNIEKVSDDQYFSDMSTRIISTSRVNLPQEGYVNYQDENWNFNALAQKYQTLDELSFPYERLPQLTLSGNKEWQYANGELFTQWTYFDRNKDAPKLATGNRVVAYPSINVPFTSSYGFITPKLGLHASTYLLNDNDFNVNGQLQSENSLTRTLPVFSLDTGLFFDKESTFLDNKYTQTIEPRLFYVYIPYDDQSKIPVFDTALSDLNLTTLFTENQFVGSDRVNNANQVSLALTTRFIDSDTGIERISATLGQRFYFQDQKVFLPGMTASNRKTSDIIAGFTARLSSQWKLDAFWQYDPDASKLARSNLLARYNPEPGKLLNMGYRYTQDFLEQINVSGQWPLGNGWYGVGRYNYSIRDKNAIESLAGVEYDAGCWTARGVVQRVETATADANYGFFFQLELGGLASIGSNPLNLLRRDIPGFLSSSEIPNLYRQQNYNQ
jgi:LPS-assembly protein